jgi:negative regulator of flagellin synthesis FlgM
MVDPVGIKGGPVFDRSRLAPVAASAQAQPARSTQGDVQQASGARSLTQSMAATPPVDADRVARIKKAIEDGRFPLVPSTIADRLIALRLQWNPNDAA